MSTYGKLSKIVIILLTITAFLGCGNKEKGKKAATQPKNNIAVDDSLRGQLTKFATQPRTKGQFAFHVYDLTADKPVYGFNEKKALPVASCLKLLSGVAGLYLLGTQYTYASSIYTRGTLNGDTWMGDIAFKGDLDPQLTEQDLGMFAKALKDKGIKKLSGHFIFDLLLKEPVKSEQHWFPWDLSFSRYGVLYKGSPKVMTAMKAALRNQGITVTDNQMVLNNVPKGSQCLFRFRCPLNLVIQRMWKHSSNTQATSLLYTIGHRSNPRIAPTEAGVAYLHKFMKQELKLNDPALVVHDGCGLCTYNHLSPLALTTILRFGYNHPDIYKALLRNLSISGVDGTLRGELNDAKLRGRIFGKTGTLSHPYGISSLAGYCQGSNGHVLAFSIVDSEMSVLDARVLQDKLCRILVGK